MTLDDCYWIRQYPPYCGLARWHRAMLMSPDGATAFLGQGTDGKYWAPWSGEWRTTPTGSDPCPVWDTPEEALLVLAVHGYESR